MPKMICLSSHDFWQRSEVSLFPGSHMIKTVETTWKILRLTSDVQLSSSTNNSASSAHKFDLDTSDFGLILPFRDNFSSLMLSSSNLSLSIDLSFDKALAETHRNLLAVVVSPPISGENSDEFNFFCFVSKADFCSAMASEHGGHFHSICKKYYFKDSIAIMQVDKT